MPEPVEQFNLLTKAQARKAIGLDYNGKVIACLGEVSEGKNAIGLIRAFLNTPESPSSRLLLVGKQDDAVRRWVYSLNSTHMHRLIQIDRYVENEFFLNCFCASDVLAIPYKNRNASSGVFVRAAYARRPVITDNQGYLAKLNTAFGFGVTCDTMEPSSFSKAIITSLFNQQGHAHNEAQERFRQFHKQENFCKTWTHGLTNMSDSPAENPITWDWVTDALPIGFE